MAFTVIEEPDVTVSMECDHGGCDGTRHGMLERSGHVASCMAQATSRSQLIMCLMRMRGPTTSGSRLWVHDQPGKGPPSENNLYDLRVHRAEGMVADGSRLVSTHIGRIHGWMRGANGEEIPFDLPDVLVVPGLAKNLLSVKRVTAMGGTVQFSAHGADIIFDNGRVPCAPDGSSYSVIVELKRKLGKPRMRRHERGRPCHQ